MKYNNNNSSNICFQNGKNETLTRHIKREREILIFFWDRDSMHSSDCSEAQSVDQKNMIFLAKQFLTLEVINKPGSGSAHF